MNVMRRKWIFLGEICYRDTVYKCPDGEENNEKKSLFLCGVYFGLFLEVLFLKLGKGSEIY